jgi:hypothetical protein
MSQTCNRCYRIMHRSCQNDTETMDCPNLHRPDPVARRRKLWDRMAEQIGEADTEMTLGPRP